jgi:DegV family protein with EDD domain
MSKIIVVTDSTADIPKDYIDKLGIEVVPLIVNFSGTVFLDGIDITPDIFYDKLKASAALPKTSQPSPDSFVEKYKEVFKKHGDDARIISIHISSKLSGTLQSATIAKNIMGENHEIYPVDSMNASMGLGLTVIKAAKLAQEGIEPKMIIESLQGDVEKTQLVAILETLDYLKKGGRISPARAFLGTMLNIKPIIHIVKGEVETLDKARGKKKGVVRMFEHMLSDVNKDKAVTVGYTQDRKEAEEFAQEIKNAGVSEVIISQVGSVIGTYSGPGALALFYTKN